MAATLPPDRNWRVDAEKSRGGYFPWIFDHAAHFFATAKYLLLDQKITEVYAITYLSKESEKEACRA